MKFHILREASDRLYTLSDWSILQEQDGGYYVSRLSGLCWDEMLDTCVGLMYLDRSLPDAVTSPEAPPTAVWSLFVEALRFGDGATNQWMISRDDRFISELTVGEALGFIAAYTLTDGRQQLFGGLRSYEQQIMRIGYRLNEPVALLGSP